MPWLQYYAEENLRWPQLHEAPARFDEAVIAIKLWARARGLPPIAVERTRGNRHSHAGGSKRIRLNTEYLSWLVVAHEFAHCWLHFDRKRSGQNPWRGRAHGTEHAERVDILCRALLKEEWAIDLAHAMAKRENRERERVAARPPPHVVKIEKREEQIKRLSRKIKGLTTRLKKAQRSLSALKRKHPEL